jgi:hypothetical protein
MNILDAESALDEFTLFRRQTPWNTDVPNALVDHLARLVVDAISDQPTRALLVANAEIIRLKKVLFTIRMMPFDPIWTDDRDDAANLMVEAAEEGLRASSPGCPALDDGQHRFAPRGRAGYVCECGAEQLVRKT